MLFTSHIQQQSFDNKASPWLPSILVKRDPNALCSDKPRYGETLSTSLQVAMQLWQAQCWKSFEILDSVCCGFFFCFPWWKMCIKNNNCHYHWRFEWWIISKELIINKFKIINRWETQNSFTFLHTTISIGLYSTLCKLLSNGAWGRLSHGSKFVY